MTSQPLHQINIRDTRSTSVKRSMVENMLATMVVSCYMLVCNSWNYHDMPTMACMLPRGTSEMPSPLQASQASLTFLQALHLQPAQGPLLTWQTPSPCISSPQSFLPLTDRFLGHRLEGRVSMDNKTGRSNRRLQVASNRRNSKLHMLQALVQDVQAQLNPWTFFVWDPRSCEQSLCHYMDLMIYHIYGDSIPVMIYMVIQSRFYLSSERRPERPLHVPPVECRATSDLA